MIACAAQIKREARCTVTSSSPLPKNTCIPNVPPPWPYGALSTVVPFSKRVPFGIQPLFPAVLRCDGTDLYLMMRERIGNWIMGGGGANPLGMEEWIWGQSISGADRLTIKLFRAHFCFCFWQTQLASIMAVLQNSSSSRQDIEVLKSAVA